MNFEKIIKDKQTEDARLTGINYFGKQTKITKIHKMNHREAQQRKATARHTRNTWKPAQEPEGPSLKYIHQLN